MAFTIIKKMRGDSYSIGKSLFDEAGYKIVDEILADVKKNNVELILPVDFVIADDFKAEANTKVVSVDEGIPDGWMGLDCGPKSTELFKKAVLESKTVVWNGPAGVFEMEPFSKCTFGIAEALAELTKAGGVAIIGGGDSATAIKKCKLTDKVSHVSTGGGAAVELMEGKVLPGVARLSDKK